MMSYFKDVMEVTGTALDGVGVLVVVVGAMLATVRVMHRGSKEQTSSYQLYRQDLGRAILLGLEFLVAGDIIRTVVVSPTLQNVIILGLIVLIRTFLSIALELEIEGRWPWESKEASSIPTTSPPAS